MSRNCKDYSATLAKRERIGGKVGDYEYLFLKLRHHPLQRLYVFPDRAKGAGSDFRRESEQRKFVGAHRPASRTACSARSI